MSQLMFLEVLLIAILIVIILFNYANFDILGNQKPIMMEFPNKEKQIKRQRLEDENKRRLQQVKIECKRLKYKEPVDPLEFIVSNQYKAAYCNIPKIGSSSIKNKLLQLELNKNLEKHPEKNWNIHVEALKLLRKLDFQNRTVAKQFSKFFKFLFVRHPFERIVSLYKDKVENRRSNSKSKNWYQKVWVPSMVKFRGSASLATGDMTFEEFVRFLVEKPVRVQYENFRGHWKPYWERCQPCLVHYDFIGTLSSFDKEMAFVLDKIGVSNQSEIFWNNKSERKSSAKKMYPSASYFSQLNRSIFEKLYGIYETDFKLFNFSIYPFANFTKF